MPFLSQHRHPLFSILGDNGDSGNYTLSPHLDVPLTSHERIKVSALYFFIDTHGHLVSCLFHCK